MRIRRCRLGLLLLLLGVFCVSLAEEPLDTHTRLGDPGLVWAGCSSPGIGSIQISLTHTHRPRTTTSLSHQGDRPRHRHGEEGDTTARCGVGPSLSLSLPPQQRAGLLLLLLRFPSSVFFGTRGFKLQIPAVPCVAALLCAAPCFCGVVLASLASVPWAVCWVCACADPPPHRTPHPTHTHTHAHRTHPGGCEGETVVW